ncbi:cubilin [Elysia marginata]|uniref:Cubilin n=1 Tax=Elysia marginata TaxID=1093978 RepID=A0AAV4JRY7_9GAST|nr:cubilin [Elysia marginata]
MRTHLFHIPKSAFLGAALLFVTSLTDGASLCDQLRIQKEVRDEAENYTFPEPLNANASVPSLTQGYEKTATCEMLFKPSSSTDQVKLAFGSVDLDPPETPGNYTTCRDKIVLYDGDSTSAPILSTICGGRTPTVLSKDNSILLVFTRDPANNRSDRGFSLTYQAFEDLHSPCGQGRIEITTFDGPIIFKFSEQDSISRDDRPFSGYPYGKNISACTLLFEPLFSTSQVKMVFENVNLNPPEIAGDYDTCADKIVLYDGNATSDPILATVCGGLTPTVFSKNKSILLVFTRDPTSNRSERNFSLTYESFEDLDSSCGQKRSADTFGLAYNFLEPSNANYSPFHSTPFKKPYPCGILFESSMSSLRTHQMHMAFRKVDLDPPKTAGDYNTCGDKVVLYDGNTTSAPILATACGGSTPNVQSTGNSILLVFTRDPASNSSHRGFSLETDTFFEVPSSCGQGGIEKTAMSYPSVFNFPDDTFNIPIFNSPQVRFDKNITTCAIFFKPDSYFSSAKLKLDFESVDLDTPGVAGDYNTCADKIVLYDGNTTSAPILATACGGLTPTVLSTDNSILLVFTRDPASNSTDTGFSLTYQAFEDVPSLCGRERIVKTAVQSKHLMFQFPEDTYKEAFSISPLYRYEKNITTCEVLFKPFFSVDQVKLVFEWVDLDPPAVAGDYTTCREDCSL